ncbi:MAG: endonuclease/exonuclease/phosphatase family protein, partial [Chitinophagaceae bacterium]
RSKLLSVSPGAQNFGEITSGNSSTSQVIAVQSIGYGGITITVPAGYQLSTNNTVFTSSITLDQATAESGTTVYARFSPSSKALKWEGKINFIGTGLDSNFLTLTGSSYPKAETFDAGAYNLSFFGSNPTNNPTPQKITTQINNIATVLQRLNLDVVGIEEMSNDAALATLIAQMPNYAAVVSDRWSYSFIPPDPNFPPQKVGFIYNTTTMQLIDSRAMFVGLYDSVSNGTSHAMDDYPTGTPSSFWASGRLPFIATFNATINGVTKKIRLIDIHAKSASDAESYRRRLYDIKVLKDSLDAYYKNDNIILVGDYNDRVLGSINVGSTSPYKIFVDDNANYNALTLPLDQAGRVSFISGTALIDHIIISNELLSTYISSSTDIEDPRTYISGYNATTASDHLPIYSRFSLLEALPVTLTSFSAEPKGKRVLISWTTASELNNSQFTVERSADGKNFSAISSIKGAGTTNSISFYQIVDSIPMPGVNYYRLKQYDIDGRQKLSDIVSVNMSEPANNSLRIYPNPVGNKINFLNIKSASTKFVGQVMMSDGKVLLQVNGNIGEINQEMNRILNKLKPGLYVFKISNVSEHQTVRFMKK